MRALRGREGKAASQGYPDPQPGSWDKLSDSGFELSDSVFELREIIWYLSVPWGRHNTNWDNSARPPAKIDCPLMDIEGFWRRLRDFNGFWWFLMDFCGFWLESAPGGRPGSPQKVTVGIPPTSHIQSKMTQGNTRNNKAREVSWRGVAGRRPCHASKRWLCVMELLMYVMDYYIYIYIYI